MREPIILPTVLAIITITILNSPDLTRKPAKGMTPSLGTGATMLSRTIRKNTPKYPRLRIISVKS
jgi:hypothetical protein